MAQIDNLTLEIKADVTKATTPINNLSNSLDTLKTNMSSVVKNYKSLVKDLAKVSVSTTNLKAIKDISKSLSSLNSIKAKNIENTAMNLRSLTDSIKGISLAKTNLDKVKEIGKIGTTLSKFNGVSANNISKSADGVTSLSTALNGISISSIEKLERVANALAKIPAYTSVKSALNSTSGGGGRKGNAKAGISTTQLPAQLSGTQNIMGGDIRSIDTSNLNKATNDAEKAISIFSILKAIKANPVIKGITTSLGILTKAFKKVIAPITHFVKALARIAFYRFLRTILKNISQGIQEGIQNLALYSKAMEELDAHSANNVMSRYASEFLYFKNAIATAVIPVLRGLIPVIETVINRIVDLINVIAQFGSAFFGGTFTKAKYFWVDYADSLDNATGSAKKLHHQLAGFDELNNLTDSNKGGGSDKLLDASQMFEESAISEKIKGFVDKIKGMFEGIKSAVQPYYEKFKELWGKIVEKVSPNLKKIWDNLKRIWAVLSPIINAFNTGFLKGYLDGIDFKNLPDDLGKIAEAIADVTGMIADLFEKIDVDKVKDFAEKLGYMTGKANGALSPFNLLANAIHGFALAIDLSRLAGQKFAEWILQHLGDIIELRIKFENLRDKVNLATGAIIAIKEKISEFIVSVMTGSFGSNNIFGKAKELANTVKDTIQYVIDKINLFKSASIASSGHGGIFTSVNSTASVLQSTIQAIINLINTLNGMSATIRVNLEGSIASGFSGSALGGVADAVKNIIDNTKETIKTVTSSSVASTGHTSSQPSGYQYGNPNQQVKSLAELKKKANGGYVPNGDLFLANEKGAEFIGAIGGNTAVANNNQITEAIAQATYTAMSQALSENGGSVNIVVEGDADRMFKVFQKKQREVSRTAGLAY
ncbi:MAG: hypothetical protein J6S67_15205 [Methanobrevibacter sp.]|nr:hypothetical protein [Methanobrevibacter sp.]